METGRSDRFLEEQLGPVLGLPGRPRGTLLATLEALFDSQFNVAETARRLGVRRQSVYYRLDQLRGLLGDLERPGAAPADRRAGAAQAGAGGRRSG